MGEKESNREREREREGNPDTNKLAFCLQLTESLFEIIAILRLGAAASWDEEWEDSRPQDNSLVLAVKIS